MRQKIRRGLLTDPLPGENRLATDLGISRSTVRDALQILAREGLIRISKGKRTRLAAPSSKARRAPGGLSICVVGSFESRFLDPFHGTLLGQIRLYFAEAGLPWRQFFSLPQHHITSYLDEITAQQPGAFWLLVGASKEVQEYFQKKRHQAIILGTNYPGVALPAIDPDYRALATHAGNLLWRRGCRRVVSIVPEEQRAGDTLTRETLATVLSDHPEVKLSEEIASKTHRSDIARLCDRVLRRVTPKTALFCYHSEFTISLMSRAAQLGLKVGRDLFLLSRDDHAYFSFYFPEISRYSIPQDQLNRQIHRVVARLRGGLPFPSGSHFITPELVEGETLPKIKRGTLH